MTPSQHPSILALSHRAWPRTLLAPAATGAACAVLLAAAVPAATPQGEAPMVELDEIQVTSKAVRPLEDYVEFPRYDSVTISPGGTHLVTGWTEDNFYRQLSFVDFPSMKPHNSRVLQQFLGVSDVRWASEDRVVVQPDWPMHGFPRIREPLRSILVTDVEGRSVRELNATPPNFLEPIDQLRRDEAVSTGPRQLNTGRQDHPDNGKDPDRNALGPVRLIEARNGTPGQLLFHTTRTDRDGNTDGYGTFTLDLASGKQSRVAPVPLPEARMVTGPEHQVALAWGTNAANESLVYYLPPGKRSGGGAWQLRMRTPSG
jgi:hypothetical protein